MMKLAYMIWGGFETEVRKGKPMVKIASWIFIVLWNLAPIIFIIASFRSHYKRAKAHNRTISRETIFGTVIAGILTTVFILSGIIGIFESNDAQAGIGLIFLPIFGIFVAVVTYAVGQSSAVIYNYFTGKSGAIEAGSRGTPRQFTGAIFILVGVMVLGYFVYYSVAPYGRAESEEVTREELIKLYKGTVTGRFNYHMQMRLAQNPKTPPYILRELSKNTGISVSYRVAGNPSTPLDVLQEFLSDPDWVARAYAVGNPSIPKEVLNKLEQDENDFVRRRAKMRLGGGAPDPPPPKFKSAWINIADLLFD